jgi:hypothetical protein
MYSREQSFQIRKSFWTTFGQYMAPLYSAEGLKVNWLNFKTGLKYVYFRMDADNRNASIGIELSHPDVDIQELFFEQFLEFKNILHSCIGEDWEWLLHATDENGKIISRIYKELAPVNVLNQNDWPTLISFLKPRIIALDEFWSDAKYAFDALK